MDDVSTSGGNSAPASAGPATFAEAFASDASPAPGSPAESNTPPAAELPATDAAASPQQPDERSPFIPRARFDEVNTERAALKAFKEQFGWAEQVDRHAIQQLQPYAQMFATDRAAFLRQVIADSMADATLGPQIRSELGRALATRGAQPQTEPQPDLPIELADGRVVHLYSAEQQAKREAWVREQLLGQIKQEFAPVVQTTQAIVAEREATARQRQADEYGTTTFAKAQKWPGMDSEDNRKAVHDAIKAMNLQSDDPRDVSLALNEAYLQVVVPKLTQSAQSKLLDTLQQKAAASTSPNPGSAAPASQKAYKSFNDLPAEAWR
jgi:hypothetical protein